MKIRTVAQTLFFGLALSLAGRADGLPSTPTRHTPFRCVTESRICWFIDSNGVLQGVGNISELGMGIALANGSMQLFGGGVDARTLVRTRVAYARIMDTLQRRWTVAARMMVSDSLHANLNALALSASQVATQWNDQVRGQVDREISERNDLVSGVLMTGVGAVAFSLPGGILFQSAVLQVLARAVVPLLLESSGYSFSDLPREFSSRLQGLAVDQLEGDIQKATDLILGQAALHYLMLPNGETQLRADSDDQRAQVALLSGFAGSPARMIDLARALKTSRDFRLIYASKIASVLGPHYEEHINSFIVTGVFAEMAWQSNGLSARGVIYDLYVPETPAAQQSPSQPFEFLIDQRHKRRWRVNGRWELVARDHGSFMEGRFGQVRLILPYWDEAVVPYGESRPVLRGNYSSYLSDD